MNLPDVPTFADLCIANFIELVKQKSYEEFNINEYANIEIVQIGQNIQSRAEEGYALSLTDKKTIKEKFNGVYSNVAFYIRVI